MHLQEYRTRIRRALLLCLLCAVGACAQSPTTLRVAAAADLQPVLSVLAPEYEAQRHVHLVISYGSSTALTVQIVHGAPFDLFLSADTEHPQSLIDGHHALSPRPVLYAQGTVVLWARKDSPVQPLAGRSFTSVVLDPKLKTLALANPTHAPYGHAAIDTLEDAGVLKAVSAKLVYAENVAQAAQFAESGDAQAGLISKTSAMTPHFLDVGSFIDVPGRFRHTQQAAVVLNKATDRTTAEAFLQWLLSDAVQSRLVTFGLEPAPHTAGAR